jgi:hypothetical protein
VVPGALGWLQVPTVALPVLVQSPVQQSVSTAQTSPV